MSRPRIVCSALLAVVAVIVLALLWVAYKGEGTVSAVPLPSDADFSRGWAADPSVALTFDADDKAPPRPEILDILARRNVKATFFLTGRFIEAQPDLVRRIVREGHEVGNHMYGHAHLLGGHGAPGIPQGTVAVTREFVQQELAFTERLFETTTGAAMAKLWRAPFGEHTAEIRAWAVELGYRHVGWTQNPVTGENLDSLDWVADRASWLYFTAAQIRTRILNFGDATPEGLRGGIVLFHLGSDRRDDRLDGELPAIIDGIRSRGYRLVPVSSLTFREPPPSPRWSVRHGHDH